MAILTGMGLPELALLIVPIYYIPLCIAGVRKHSRLFPIVLVNIFLGWTFVGWIAALVWAFIDTVPVAASLNDPAESDAGRVPLKHCPYCAEEINKEAIFCRFCNREMFLETVSGGQGAVPVREPDTIGKAPIEAAPAEEEKQEVRELPPDWVKKALQFHMKNEQYEEAVIAFSTAIDADETDAGSYFFRAVAYTGLDDDRRALRDLEKSAALGYQKAIDQLRRIKGS